MLYQNFRCGINLGGWLSQYELLIDAPLTNQKLEAHLQTFLTETDIQQIASWGFDHVRLPVSGYFLFDCSTQKLNPCVLQWIDLCIDWCRSNHLNLVLDLHDLWGNVYGAMDTPMPLLTDPKLKQNFYRIWEQLTAYYQGTSGIVLLFELLNEVSDASGSLWNQLYTETIRRIRVLDPERPVLVGSNAQNSVAYLKQLSPLNDELVFYNFHYYEPQVFTHQRAHFSEEMMDYHRTVNYPDDISSFATYLQNHPQYQMKYALTGQERTHDHALMSRLLQNALNFHQETGRALYCGEFGVINSAPPEEAAKWLRDFCNLLDSNQIGHALWNYKALDFGLLDMDGKVVHPTLLKSLQGINRQG